MDSIIIDLDGTLADNTHREHYLDQEPQDWDGFYSEILDDTLNQWCYEIIERFKDDYKVYLVTGREGRQQVRNDTEQWLQEFDVEYDELYMRPEGDRREDSTVKQEILDEHIGAENVLFAVDDRDQVIDTWRDNDITALQCADPDF